MFGIAIGIWTEQRLDREFQCSVCASQERYSSIQKGMSEEQVETALGGPPGYYVPQEYDVGLAGGSWLPPGNRRVWETRDGHIVVGFNEEGTVMSKRFWYVMLVPKPTLFERVRARIGF
jgi:hypothetical protein